MSSVAACPFSLENAVLGAGFCAFEWEIEISRPRGVLAVGAADALVLERDTSSVLHVFDSDGDGIPDAKRSVATASGLNHGLALNGDYIYASSDTTVYRWPYEATNFTTGDVEVVVVNINADGAGGAPQGHRTRTLVFDDIGRLYISVGSYANVDEDSYRSRIRRFDLKDGLSQDFSNGEVFADGLRNEVGMAFDKHGVLWGVENGADNLFRSDLGGDIKNDNPAEELNRFKEEDAGKHWGYPFCWTEYILPEGVGLGQGTVWAWPSFLSDGLVTDSECRADYVPPVVSMQAHSAPLGITFYQWKPSDELPIECGSNPGDTAFPEEMDGYAFIAFHGSWNRDIPTGYKVVYVEMDESGDAKSEPIDLLWHQPPNAQWNDGFRPVDVAFDGCGRLIVTSDGTGGNGSKLVRIEFGRGTSPSPPPSNDYTLHLSSPPTDATSTLSPAGPSPRSLAYILAPFASNLVVTTLVLLCMAIQ